MSVWVYEGTLKIEYQATTLSLYSVRVSPNHQQIIEVKNARRIETHFRSPQLDLWQIAETEWLLAFHRPQSPRSHEAKSCLVRDSNTFHFLRLMPPDSV